MKKAVSAIMLITLCISVNGLYAANHQEDVDDPRGKMVPWEKGAWETGQYRNVFLEAGYKQEEIDAKLAKAYHDLFEGPNRVYFEVGAPWPTCLTLKTAMPAPKVFPTA